MKTLLFTILIAFSSLSFGQEMTFFTDVDFSSTPYVRVEVADGWRNLLRINGVSREEIMNKCTAIFSDQCQCMFTEKFTETMAAIGLPIEPTLTKDASGNDVTEYSVLVGLYDMDNHLPYETTLPLTVETQDELYAKRVFNSKNCY